MDIKETLQSNEELVVLLEGIAQKSEMNLDELWIVTEAVYRSLEFIEVNKLRDEVESEMNKLVTAINKRLLQTETSLHAREEAREKPAAICEKQIYRTGLTSQGKHVTLH